MVVFDEVKDLLACYYIEQREIETSHYTYLYKFTTEVKLILNLGFSAHEFVQHRIENNWQIILSVVNTNTGIGSGEFKVNEHITISYARDLHPLTLLSFLYNKFAFNTGRKINYTADIIRQENIFIGKNNISSFLKSISKISPNYKYNNSFDSACEFVHIVELPIKNNNNQLLLSTRYSANTDFPTSSYNILFILTLHKNKLYFDTKEPIIVKCSLETLISKFGWDNITTVNILELFNFGWDEEIEEAKQYAIRCTKIDNLLEEL